MGSGKKNLGIYKYLTERAIGARACRRGYAMHLRVIAIVSMLVLLGIAGTTPVQADVSTDSCSWGYVDDGDDPTTTHKHSHPRGVTACHSADAQGHLRDSTPTPMLEFGACMTWRPAP